MPRNSKRAKRPQPPTTDKPKLKKDGTPWTPWADEVALRLKVKEERIAAGLPVRTVKKPCKAHTTGIHGPRRPCSNGAVPGLDVCHIHGGGSKAAKDAAKKRLIEELDPTISRMIEIRDQSDHLPSALGAATHILNRVMGKPDAVDKDKGAGRAIINVGIAIAGIPPSKAAVQITDGNTFEGETVDEDDDTPDE